MKMISKVAELESRPHQIKQEEKVAKAERKETKPPKETKMPKEKATEDARERGRVRVKEVATNTDFRHNAGT